MTNFISSEKAKRKVVQQRIFSPATACSRHEKHWKAVMRWFLLLIVVSCPIGGNAFGFESVRFEQAVTDGPNIWVYLDVRSADDAAATTEQIGDVRVFVGGKEASVESVEPFSESGEGVGYIFLVDVSASITKSNYDRIKRALADWIGAMKPNDMAAIITFGSKVERATDFTGDRDRLRSAVERLEPRDQHTLLYQGLEDATALGARHRLDPKDPRRKLIVTLSDGDNDVPGPGVRLEEIEKTIVSSRIPLHAIAFNANKEGAEILERLARRSNGSFLSVEQDRGIGGSYADLRLRINDAIVVEATCDDCPLDGRNYPLDVRLAGAGSVPGELAVKMSPGTQPPRPLIDETPPPPQSPPPPPPKYDDLMSDWRVWASVGGAVAVLAAILAFLVFRKKPKPAPPVHEPPRKEDKPEPGTRPIGPQPRPLPSGHVRFTVMSGVQKGEVFDVAIEDSVILGRAKDCDLTISGDDEMSRQHASAMFKNGKLVIADLKASHGTYVNGVRVQGERVVSDGDTVRMGRTELHISV